MLTPSGPKCLEYNCRFGDPETQVILPLLDESCSLAQIMLAGAQGRLDSIPIAWKAGASACTVVACSGGYPASYKKGIPMDLNGLSSSDKNIISFHAGTMIKD